MRRPAPRPAPTRQQLTKSATARELPDSLIARHQGLAGHADKQASFHYPDNLADGLIQCGGIDNPRSADNGEPPPPPL